MTRDNTPFTLRLICTSGSQFSALLDDYAGRILGVLAYGADEPQAPPHDVLFAWIPMPVFEVGVWYEVWVSSQAVTVNGTSGRSFASDGDLLFGIVSLDYPGDALDAAAFSAYSTLFDMLDQEDYKALLRVWNYFPRINDDSSGTERYRAFNVGRHEAFWTKGRDIAEGVVPAACALGARQGHLQVCFFAGKVPGTVIENPRQVNAYRYPRYFGRRSPTFSRGILVGNALFISGTASIVGSNSVHPGDVALQVDETLRNLKTVVEQAGKCGFDASDPAGLHLNVYVRRADDYPIVRRMLERTLRGVHHVAYMMADVCRADLLVEIEAFWLPQG